MTLAANGALDLLNSLVMGEPPPESPKLHLAEAVQVSAGISGRNWKEKLKAANLHLTNAEVEKRWESLSATKRRRLDNVSLLSEIVQCAPTDLALFQKQGVFWNQSVPPIGDARWETVCLGLVKFMDMNDRTYDELSLWGLFHGMHDWVVRNLMAFLEDRGVAESYLPSGVDKSRQGAWVWRVRTQEESEEEARANLLVEISKAQQQG